MTPPDARARRADPYRAFRYRVQWDGRYVAGVSEANALGLSPGVVEHREGNAAETVRTAVGRPAYAPIVLERGVTHDAEFAQWAGGAAGALAPMRRDLVLEVHDERGRLAAAYRISRSWVSELQALPELDASASAVTIQRLQLEHEGWTRDDAAGGDA